MAKAPEQAVFAFARNPRAFSIVRDFASSRVEQEHST